MSAASETATTDSMRAASEAVAVDPRAVTVASAATAATGASASSLQRTLRAVSTATAFTGSVLVASTGTAETASNDSELVVIASTEVLPSVGAALSAVAPLALAAGTGVVAPLVATDPFGAKPCPPAGLPAGLP